MIKCETINGDLELEVNGKITDIASDSVYIISQIYISIRKNNKQHSEDFKRLIMMTLPKVFDLIDNE